MAKRRKFKYLFEIDGRNLPFSGARAAALEYLNSNPDCGDTDIVEQVTAIFGPYHKNGASTCGMVAKVRQLHKKIAAANLLEHIKPFSPDGWDLASSKAAQERREPSGKPAETQRKPTKSRRKPTESPANAQETPSDDLDLEVDSDPKSVIDMSKVRAARTEAPVRKLKPRKKASR